VSLPGWLALAALVVVLTVVALRAARSTALETIRADWGKPRPRTHRFDAIAASHASRVSELGTPAALDDRTWNDLDLDDVFAAIDRTDSTLGQHALYHRLRTAPDLEAFEALVTRMSESASERERAQLALARLQDPHGYDLWWIARPGAVEAPAWYAVFPALAATTLALLALLPFQPHVLPVLVASLAVNVVVHFATFQRVGEKAAAFRQLAPVIATGQALRFLRGDGVDPIVRPFEADLPALGRLKTIARWVSGDPLMLSVSPHMGAVMVADVVNAVYEYLNMALPLDAMGLYFGAGDLSTRGMSLLRVVAAIGDVDAAISVASLRAGRSDWARPRFLPAGQPAIVTEARHPLVADAVPNSITLEPGAGVLVTGSNMSGKSTFLRTIGVTAVLAQTIHTCLATEYAAPVFNIRSCIGRADDLLSGRSYYIVEVEALLSLVTASEAAAPHLFLLDELFRGTNAVERIAAGEAVLVELLRGGTGPKPHVVLAATHDGELVEMLAGRYSAWHFGDAIGGDGLTFDHRLMPGRATSRNAITLLRLHGAPSTLIERALASAGSLDRDRRY
jgi:MutS domain V